jgi:hypothetical protein
VALFFRAEITVRGGCPNCRFYNNFKLFLHSTICPKIYNLQSTGKNLQQLTPTPRLCLALRSMDLALRRCSSPLSWGLFFFCQTPTPGESWELTLLSRGHKKKKKNNNKNEPHLNSPRRGCRMVSNFCMGS